MITALYIDQAFTSLLQASLRSRAAVLKEGLEKVRDLGRTPLHLGPLLGHLKTGSEII